MSQQRPLGAQISHMLKARGVDVVFGIPGVHNQELYRGIEEAGITHVLARHEQGAGFMADGYARATGRPGVCYVITGPGVLNALTPLGQAYSDSVPVLMVASCLDETAATRGQLHQMRDQEGAAATVTDWSDTAQTPQAAYALIDRALQDMATNRPRPKALHVPIAQLEAEAAPDWPAKPFLGPRPVEPEPDWITYTAQEVAQAKRPLFIFGGGARDAAVAPVGQGQPTPVQALLARSGAAAFTTFAGRGIVPADYPLLLGSYLSRPEAEGLIGSADLVIAIGTELAEVDLWRDQLGHSGRLIRVDIDAEPLASNLPGQTPIRSDATRFVQALTDALGDGAPQTGWTQAEAADFRARMRSAVSAERPGLLGVIDAVQAAMPTDAMIYSDMCQLAYAAKEVWNMDRPGHWHHPYGFGTLGYALPAGIGGAVARPDGPTCVIIGDYGLQYTLPELGTAVELGLPLPIILWDNGKLGEIEDSMIRAQIAPNAVIQQNPDFLMLARAYGADAVEPATLADIAPALRAAFKACRPTVIRLTPDLFS
ncbi:thiamine pyrophosphate-binding protein [Pseudooctadecabacter sp.]|uniref:thiamine pyrophosphate-binding protein n=1 Tax=Pseudooctadecabacter sp. TaxID=1966338 RepID=UPI002600A8C9|nr:thiamine pyrophosphate-binding protein [Pseudooctadecabacter sp.]